MQTQSVRVDRRCRLIQLRAHCVYLVDDILYRDQGLWVQCELGHYGGQLVQWQSTTSSANLLVYLTTVDLLVWCFFYNRER